MDKPKRKKPEWEKHKTVYFNTQHPEDAELFDYIQRIASRNFSAYMKRLAYEDMQRRVQIPRSPFDGTPLEAETIPVSIKPMEVPAPQPKVIPPAEQPEESVAKVVEPEIPVQPEPQPDPPKVKKEPVKEPVKEEVVKEEVVKEEAEEESQGFDFLDNAANLFKRKRED